MIVFLKRTCNVLLLVSIVFYSQATAANSSGYTAGAILAEDASVADIERVFNLAKNLFESKKYEDAIPNFYQVVGKANSNEEFDYVSWLSLGEIFIFKKDYPRALNHLLKARGIYWSDKANSLIKIANSPPGSRYVIQVGVFDSAYNANQVIKNINPTNDNFTLVKEKHDGRFFVFFDGFKGRAEADAVAERLKSLNVSSGVEFFVRKL